MTADQRKQIPFRYGPVEEEDLKELYYLQYSTTKTNEALRDALKIAANVIKGFKKANPNIRSWDLRRKIVNTDFEKISKTSGQK